MPSCIPVHSAYPEVVLASWRKKRTLRDSRRPRDIRQGQLAILTTKRWPKVVGSRPDWTEPQLFVVWGILVARAQFVV